MALVQRLHNIYYKIVGYRTFCPRLTGRQAIGRGADGAQHPLSHALNCDTPQPLVGA